MKPKKPKPKSKSRRLPVNTAFIKKLIEQKGISGREVARKLKIDASSFLHTMTGRRRIQLHEAIDLAKILEVQKETIFEAFGIDLRGVSTGKESQNGSVTLSGYLNAALVLTADGLKGKREVMYPFGGSDIRAARFQTAGSPSSSWDGAIVFWRERPSFKKKGVDAELLGKAAMVKIADGSELRLRELRRGYAPGRYNLAGLNGQVLEEDVLVSESHPVVMIRMS